MFNCRWSIVARGPFGTVNDAGFEPCLMAVCGTYAANEPPSHIICIPYFSQNTPVGADHFSLIYKGNFALIYK